MKNYALKAAAIITAAIMTGCNDEGPIPPTKYPDNAFIVDFEDAQLKTVTYEGFSAPTEYRNVLEGKALATFCNDAESIFYGYRVFDGILYAHESVSIGSTYNDGQYMGYGVYDVWTGFALSSNADTETRGYNNQFSVYNDRNGDNTFAVGYDSPSGGFVMGLDYEAPTIKLGHRGRIVSLDICNSAYTALEIKSIDPQARFVVKITGYNNGKKSGSVSVTLAAEGKIVDKWMTVDTSSLGDVDTVILQADLESCASDVKKPADWMPLYFCIDNIVAALYETKYE